MAVRKRTRGAVPPQKRTGWGWTQWYGHVYASMGRKPTQATKKTPLKAMAWGVLRMHNLRALKEGGGLAGDIISGVGRRITASAPHVVFLDSAFLEKVALIEEGGAQNAGANTGRVTSGKEPTPRLAPQGRQSSLHTSSRVTGVAPPQTWPVSNSFTTTRSTPVRAGPER